MPHGAPDWFKYRTTGSSFSLDDLGELATRLGAIAVFDRRGEVAFVESFEHAARNWTLASVPLGGAVTLDPTFARHGGYALRATTPAAGVNTITLTHREPPIYTGRIGVEFLLYLEQNILGLTAQFDYYDGTRHYQLTDALLATALVADSWNMLKAVVDLNTLFAVRRIINGTETDTSAVPFVNVGPTANNYLEVVVGATGAPGLQGILYVDAVVITRDEP